MDWLVWAILSALVFRPNKGFGVSDHNANSTDDSYVGTNTNAQQPQSVPSKCLCGCKWPPN